MEHMAALTWRAEAISFALGVFAHPERDEVTAGGVTPGPRVERDRVADLRAVLHPHGKVREALENGFLLRKHGLLLLCCR